MGLTEEEAEFFESLTALASATSRPFPLKIKRPGTRPRSNSFSSYPSSHNTSPSSTRSPSPSTSDASGSIDDLDTNLDSSLWSRKEGPPSRSFLLSIPAPPTPSESEQSSEVEERRVNLPPISPSRKSGPSESLPSLIPQLSIPPPPPGLYTLKPPGLSREGFGTRLTTASWDKSKQKNIQPFWNAIQEASVPIYLSTPGLDAFTLCPSALGTHCAPTPLLTALSDVEVFYHLYAAGQKLSRQDLVPSNNADGGVLQHAADVVLAEYGAALIDRNAGQHFTFINTKQDAACDLIVRRARKLVQCFQENGIAKDKVVVSIPATEQGLHATRLLARGGGILVNLSMVTGMSHAAVCAEAGAAWITFHLDRLEKAYEDRGEPSKGTKAIQSTIALFDMHNVETKIMISAFRDIRNILDFPGAHGFSVAKEQIVAAKLPTSRSYHVPPHSASSLPGDAIISAKEAKWPLRFFDIPEAGGSNGSFVRCFTPRQHMILLTTQADLFYHASLAIRDFLTVIRDDVVNYRIFMMQLLNPRTGIPTMAREGVKGLRRTVNYRRDLESGEAVWRGTITGRFLPEVEWKIAKVDRCEVWITSDGRIEAQIPEEWDRRKVTF